MRTCKISWFKAKNAYEIYERLEELNPHFVEDLLAAHGIIKSCVFHYEFELIHPFSDGNGRIGCLWHTLLLSQWNPVFAWLPIESIIHDRQSDYYAAINASNNAAESTIFIEFMLSSRKASLIDASRMIDEMSDATSDKAAMRSSAILNHMKKNGTIINADVRKMFNVSPATANRILSELVSKGKITKCRYNGHWAYELKKQPFKNTEIGLI